MRPYWPFDPLRSLGTLWRRWRAAIVFGIGAQACAAALAGSVDLVLPERSSTSAGIYHDDGRLVRTLWSGRPLDAGSFTVAWDGLDDEGTPAEASRYTAKVIAHNVRYVWEGVIGNTSRDTVGAGVHRAFNPINDMAFDGIGNAYYVVGYNEGQPAIHRFRAIDPQRQTSLLREDYRRTFRYTTTDGRLAYFANTGRVAPIGSFARQPQTFVAAIDVVTGEAYRFGAGVDADPESRQWPSVIDYDRDDHDANDEFRSAPTGLAVQRRGELLFVAHGGVGEIRVFDKRTGRPIGKISARGIGELDVGPDDSLWALSNFKGSSAILHFAGAGGEWSEISRIAGNLSHAASIAVSPVDGTIAVVDIGTEQLRAFARDGREKWTLGRDGGYKNGPTVTTDRFAFSAGPTYVAFEPNGSFWVGDPGNARNLHYSADRDYIDQIMYLPHSYVVSVDSNDPTRVFRHFLEFKVDYGAPIESSWRLVANWGVGLDRRYKGDFDGLQSVHTLRNGRTYGVVRRFDLGTSEIVELSPSGLRTTGTKLDVGTKLYADGSQRLHIIRFGALKVLSRPLEGFDDAGNPTWGPPHELAQVANLRDADPYYHDVPLVGGVNEATFPITDSGIVVSFTPGTSKGFHLGGIRPGDNRWLWRGSPSGNWDVDDHGQIARKDGRYEVGNGVHYPGNVVMASGRQIIYGYHGEAWRGGQANQWVHFLDNGLFVGQFGRPWVPAKGDPGPAVAEASGNSFSPQLVTVNGQLYLWHNDESGHAGVHRWRIDGADRVQVLEARIEP
jgi:hypothetical protein